MTKILLVEDNPDLAKCLIDIINDSSIEKPMFETADSAESALEALSGDDYNIIILDGRLSDSHGREVMEHLSFSEKRKTIVHSAEVSFLVDASKNKIDVCRKGDYEILVGLIKQKLILD